MREELDGRTSKAVLSLRSAFRQATSEIQLCPSRPPLLIASNQLAEAIRPDVESLRKELFGHTKAPFKTLRAAVRWIKAQAELQPEEAPDVSRRIRMIRKKIYQKIGEWEDIVQCS